MNIIQNIKNFFEIMDWKLVIAGFGMLFIFLLIVYLISVIVISFQKRRDQVNVKLPDIDTYDKEESKGPEFKEVKKLEVELINPNDDVVIGENNNKGSYDYFIQALSIETRKLFPSMLSFPSMPKIKAIDYEAIKKENIERSQKESFDKMKKLAEEDDREIPEDRLINMQGNGGNL